MLLGGEEWPAAVVADAVQNVNLDWCFLVSRGGARLDDQGGALEPCARGKIPDQHRIIYMLRCIRDDGWGKE